MEFCFKSFAEFEDYIYKKRLAYEELRDENRQLEMDRLRDSDRIARLEHEIYELRKDLDVYQEQDNGFLQSDCVPNMLRHTDQKIKKSPACTDE